ncbi:MAG: hypothetical protein GX041_07140 [Clostridiales bacterium]|jgi:YbbR domain-containing protein|nr:hypothetical protein [Clostridiales bacterium]
MTSRFSKNLALKIISVIFAIILWLVAIRDQNPEISRSYENIPVEIVNEAKFQAKGLSLVFDVSDTVTISVRGRARDLERINVEQLKGSLDLSVINEPGEHKLLADIQGLPSGVSLRRKPEILVRTDKLVVKNIPLVPDINIEQAQGFLAHSYRIRPAETVRVSGPLMLIDRIYQARIELELKDVSSTVEHSLPIALLDKDGQVIESKYINVEPQYAIVTIPVYPTKVLTVKPNIAGVPAENYEVVGIEVYPLQITVSGEQSILDGMQSIGTEILDIQDAMVDVKRTLKIQQYDGITTVPSSPNEVDVLVRIKEKTIEKSLIFRNIDMVNIPQNVDADLESASYEIVIRGPVTVMDSIDEEAVRLYVDLSDISRGEHRLKIMADIPAGVELVSIEPNEAVVKVK